MNKIERYWVIQCNTYAMQLVMVSTTDSQLSSIFVNFSIIYEVSYLQAAENIFISE